MNKLKITTSIAALILALAGFIASSESKPKSMDVNVALLTAGTSTCSIVGTCTDNGSILCTSTSGGCVSFYKTVSGGTCPTMATGSFSSP